MSFLFLSRDRGRAQTFAGILTTTALSLYVVLRRQAGMSVLEYAVYGARRGWQMSRTFLFAGAFAAAVVGGLFSGVGSSLAHKTAVLAMFGLWAVVFGVKAHRRFTRDEPRPSATGRADLEIGLLLVVATHAAIQMVGGLNSPF